MIASAWDHLIGARALAAFRSKGYENLLFSSLPWRDRWTAYLARPGWAIDRMRWRFALWTMIPGDVFTDFQADHLILVTAVRHGTIVGVPMSRHLVAAYAADPERTDCAVVVGVVGGAGCSYRYADGRRMIIQPDEYSRAECVDRWAVAPRAQASTARRLLRFV